MLDRLIQLKRKLPGPSQPASLGIRSYSWPVWSHVDIVPGHRLGPAGQLLQAFLHQFFDYGLPMFLELCQSPCGYWAIGVLILLGRFVLLIDPLGLGPR